MTRKERYAEQLAKLEEKKWKLLKDGRYLEANSLSGDIKEIEELIKMADEYEESLKPKPLKELVSREQLNQMGIIPLMIECHLVADFLTEVSYMVVDTIKEYGFSEVSLVPELKEIINKTDKFASFLTGVSPELCNLLVRNETFNASLHKKYLKYIEQRLKPVKQDY